jgi:membrane protease YdiL (CAAX protease family)
VLKESKIPNLFKTGSSGPYYLTIGAAVALILVSFLGSVWYEKSAITEAFPGHFELEEKIRLFISGQKLFEDAVKNDLSGLKSQKKDENLSKEEVAELISKVKTERENWLGQFSQNAAVLTEMLELQMDKKISRLTELRDSLKSKTPNDTQIDKFNQMIEEMRFLHPLVVTVINPSKFPLIMQNIKLDKNNKSLLAIMVCTLGLNSIYDPFFEQIYEIQKGGVKKKKSKTNFYPRPENGKKIFLPLSPKVPKKAYKNYLKLFTALPSKMNITRKENLITDIGDSSLSPWIKKSILYSVYHYYDNAILAEKITNHTKTQNIYAYSYFTGTVIIGFLIILGMVWLLVYRYRTSDYIIHFRILYPPTWTRSIFQIALLVIIITITQNILALIFEALSLRLSFQLFASYFLSFAVGFVVIFPELLQEYRIGLKTYLFHSDEVIKDGKKVSILKWGFGAFCVSLSLMFAVEFILNQIGVQSSDSTIVKSLMKTLESTEDYVLIFLSVCILAPFFEELFFRGYFLSGLLQKVSFWNSIIISGLIFGIIHHDPGKLIHLSILGMVLGYSRIKSGSILVPMLTHFLINLQAFLSLLIFKA